MVLLLPVNARAQELDRPHPRAAENIRVPFEGALIISEETAPVAVPEPSEKALQYYHTGNLLWLVGTAWDILVPCLFLFTGLSARLRTWAQRLGRRWFFVIAVYFIL